MVVESVVPKEQGLTLLREALSDADKSVRTIAADRLKQVTQESTE